MKLRALVLGGLLFSGLASSYEENINRYIPAGAEVSTFNYGFMKIFLWDKNKDGVLQPNELYIDINGDGIPDFSYEELLEEYDHRFEIKVESKNA